MVSGILALLKYSMIYVCVKQGSGPGTLWVQSFQIDIWGEEITHSLARLLRSTTFCCALFHSDSPRSAPLRSALLRAAPLSGSFVSEKVAMY